MSHFVDLNYVQPFQSLPSIFYTPIKPQGISNPKHVVISEACAELLGLDPKSLQSEDAISILSGQGLVSSWNPIAMKYTGHQFGHYNPELGDGRGLLLAQVKNQNNQILDLHLKGAGLTPYSRQGDGRAVLRSSIREFLCSEALYGLGVPTTRALCVVDSDTPVYRETQETAAMVLRVSQSHIRFGHFEFCSFNQPHEYLKQLCDFVIEQHYPELLSSDDDQANPNNRYAQFYNITLNKTAKMIAHWQSIGFCHGVMNTDNMSIIGDTFDFGPFAFLDDYDPNFICNHSDHQGRYAFNQQPNIANWNLAVLAQALLPLVNKESLVEKLDGFSDTFSFYYLELMRNKLGLSQPEKQEDVTHKDIIDQTLSMLAKCRLDYTVFFRMLSQINQEGTHKALRDMALDITAFDQWHKNYQHALASDQALLNDVQRSEKMNQCNPKFILRNYLAQNAIEAAQQGDYSLVNELHEVLQNPFDEQPQFNHLADLPPDWGKKLEISCSS